MPVVLAAITSGLAACSKSSDSAESMSADSKIARSDGFRVVGSLAALNKNGQILSEQSPIGPILVIRNPATPAALSAVNPTCTHQGCLVAWKGERKAFVCPCHAANFKADGTVIQGPAKKALATYTAKIEGDSVLAKKG